MKNRSGYYFFFDKKQKCIFSLCQICMVCFLLLSSFQIIASEPSFRNINMENGLSNNTINVIYKDSQGFIWLGTQNGLNRFDGINIDIYPAFNNETIFSICESDSIYLYIGSNTGLKCINKKTGNTEKIILNKQRAIPVRSLNIHKNMLYIGSDKGLYVKKEKNVTSVPQDTTGIPVVNGMCFDNHDICWMATDNGLSYYNTQTGQSGIFKYSKDNPASNKFLCLTMIGNEIYIGSESTGILVFYPASQTFRPFKKLNNDCILNLTYADGKLYAGTNGGGMQIISLSDKQVETITHLSKDPSSISSNAAYAFLKDGDIYWIGTFFAGLNYNIPDKGIFDIYDYKNELNTRDLNIRSFWTGNDGRKIIGTREGFYYISEKENICKKFSSADNPVLKSDIILNIFPWEDAFLIGTYGGGLLTFDPKNLTLSTISQNTAFTNNSFYSTCRDQSGCIWFGTLNGLIGYTPATGKVEQYTSSNSKLTNNSIYSILCDNQNRIWVAASEGMCIFDIHTRKFIPGIIPQPLKPQLKLIRHIYQDQNNDIWLCSEKSGLFRINNDGKSYQHFTDKNILPDVFAISVIEDNYGYIWIATAKGLVRYDKQTNDYSIFTLTDGIPAPMFNHVVQKDTDGRIWWANEKGLLNTLPSEKMSKKPLSPIIITSLHIGGKKIETESNLSPFTPEYTTNIKLGASANNIDIRFSGLDFNYLKGEIFEYKLDGRDSSWLKLTGQNQINYAELKPGSYKLHIRRAGSLEPERTLVIEKSKSYSMLIWGAVIVLILLTAIYYYQTLLRKFRNLSVNKKQTDSQPKYKNSKLEEEESETIYRILQQYMEEEKPYLNSRLKLMDVSVHIKYPQAKISQVLNQYLSINFTDFVNKYRVDAFKQKARDKMAQQYTLTALAEECGFNSRSSFFLVFKKITGQTPLEFLKESGVSLRK